MTNPVLIQFPEKSKLPFGTSPIGFDREQAAEYICVSPRTFDALVADGDMPQPRLLRSKLVWDGEELREAFRRLPHRGEAVTTIYDDPWGNA
jgi:hypothetical protein